MSSSIYEIRDGRARVLAVLDSRSDSSAECWLWTGGGNGYGYGRFTSDGIQFYAHRASYEAHHGPLAQGLHVPHSCDTPPCVNPEHLRAGTQKENVRDRDERGRHGQASKMHCPQGHPYDEDNTGPAGGGRRRCRTCHREANRALRARKAGSR